MAIRYFDSIQLSENFPRLKEKLDNAQFTDVFLHVGLPYKFIKFLL